MKNITNIEPKIEKNPEISKDGGIFFQKAFDRTQRRRSGLCFRLLKMRVLSRMAKTLELSLGTSGLTDKMQENRYQSPVITVLNKIF